MNAAIIDGVASIFFGHDPDDDVGDSIPWAYKIYHGESGLTSMDQCIPAGAIIWTTVAVCSH